MCKKMIKHGIAVAGISILALLSVGCVSVTTVAGPDPDIMYRVLEMENERGYRPNIENNPSDYSVGIGWKLISTLMYIKDGGIRVYGYFGYIDFDKETVNELYPLFELRFKNSNPKPSIAYISIHSKDPANPKEDLYFRLDGIEGLLSLEEAQAIVAQEEKARAEEEAAEEAIRKEREEANKYDSAKFIIVPSSFRPANYRKADLFAAVAASEKLSATAIVADGTVWPTPSIDYVSDVVFVSQNGTDITFKTADNAISRSMKVSARTGLTAGQKVRLYYTAYRIQSWQVVAIERL